MSSKAKLHARRRAARFGDLDALLAEALKQQRRGEGAVKRLKGINQIIHEQYANPLNWTDRGVLTIIYTDEKTGEQVTIGKFQDQIHRTGARRLIRVADDVPVRCCSEGCCNHTHNVEEWHDPFLVRGKPVYEYVPPPKDPLAQLAIRDYLRRQRETVKLEDFLGGDAKAKVDAQKLLNELHKMQLEKEV